MTRIVLVAALEALEVGDVRLATELLLDALEGNAPFVERAWCCACGRGFEWPGLAEAHSHLCTARRAA